MSASVTQPSLNEALDRLWKQFLPQIEERVEAMDAANRALSEGKLSTDLRATANSAAHKLAGVLGTFGLTRGTILAREAELLYCGDTDPAVVLHLKEIATELRSLVNSRK